MELKLLLIKNFEILFKDEDIGFKRKFYLSTINHLKKMDEFEIKKRDSFLDLKDIGKKINDKILEIRDSGKNLPRVETIIQNETYFDIRNVYGIGPSLKNKIEKNYGKVKDLSHLIELDKTNGFLNDKHKLGIEYYVHIMNKIPRDEIIEHDALLSEIVNHLEGECKLKYKITGSFRRKKAESGDIDVILTTTNRHIIKQFKTFIEILRHNKYIVADLAFGDKKYMGMCALPGSNFFRRLDVIMVKPEEYAFGLLYFTGSGDLNKEMRTAANEQGYSLNEKDLRYLETNEKVEGKFETEKDIFNFLGFKYVSPANRESGALQKL
jgi:DNA polymerase/3'-5' exonuclease PolX